MNALVLALGRSHQQDRQYFQRLDVALRLGAFSADAHWLRKYVFSPLFCIMIEAR
jgi:hypothetical protein